ncbi:MAG: ATP-binding protein [Solirubrobacteraceae bacterium]
MCNCSGERVGDDPGTGKSHFIEALGHLAIDKGKTVAWHTLETLAVLVRRHRADDSINKAIAKLIRSDLILVDDVGLLPVSVDAAEALFRVIDPLDAPANVNARPRAGSSDLLVRDAVKADGRCPTATTRLGPTSIRSCCRTDDARSRQR